MTIMYITQKSKVQEILSGFTPKLKILQAFIKFKVKNINTRTKSKFGPQYSLMSK